MRFKGDNFDIFSPKFRWGRMTGHSISPLRKSAPIDEVLSVEKIREIAGRKWRSQGMRVYLVTLLDGQITSVKHMKKYGGQKTLEGKMRSLQNLRPNRPKRKRKKTLGTKRKGLKGNVGEVMMTGLLDDAEKKFYGSMKKQYLKDLAGRMKTPADYVALERALAALVSIRRVNIWLQEESEKFRKSGETKSRAAHAKEIQSLTQANKTNYAQLDAAHNELGMSMKSRKEDDFTDDDVASLSAMMDDDEAVSALKERDKILRIEERQAMAAKKRRDREMGIERGVVQPLDVIREDDTGLVEDNGTK